MWKQITSKEYFELLKFYMDNFEMLEVDKTDFIDFVEIEWETSNKVPMLRKTEQENYDEFESFMPTVRYYRKELILS